MSNTPVTQQDSSALAEIPASPAQSVPIVQPTPPASANNSPYPIFEVDPPNIRLHAAAVLEIHKEAREVLSRYGKVIAGVVTVVATAVGLAVWSAISVALQNAEGKFEKQLSDVLTRNEQKARDYEKTLEEKTRGIDAKVQEFSFALGSLTKETKDSGQKVNNLQVTIDGFAKRAESLNRALDEKTGIVVEKLFQDPAFRKAMQEQSLALVNEKIDLLPVRDSVLTGKWYYEGSPQLKGYTIEYLKNKVLVIGTGNSISLGVYKPDEQKIYIDVKGESWFAKTGEFSLKNASITWLDSPTSKTEWKREVDSAK